MEWDQRKRMRNTRNKWWKRKEEKEKKEEKERKKKRFSRSKFEWFISFEEDSLKF